MSTYHRLRDRLLQLIRDTAEFSRTMGNAEAAGRLQGLASRLSEEKLQVVLCGECKQGKSSLLGALLSDPTLFPVDIDVTTSLVSTVSHADLEKITVWVGEKGREVGREIARGQIPEYVTEAGNRGNAKGARLLTIETPNPALKDGLILVDTPGIGGLNLRHTEVTYAFLPNADVVIYVSDAHATLSTLDLKFLQERIVPHCSTIVSVVTKIDDVPQWAEVVAGNRRKLAEVLGKPEAEVVVLPVSSRNKLRHLATGNTKDLERSRFEALEANLWELLQQHRGRILLARGVAELGHATGELRGPVQAEWEACQADRSRADEIESSIRRAQGRFQELMENCGGWVTALSDGLQTIRKRAMRRFEDGFVEIRRKGSSYLADERYLQDPEEMVGLLSADMASLTAELGKSVGAWSGELHSALEAMTGLDFDPLDLRPIGFQGVEFRRPEGEVTRAGWWRRTLTASRDAVFTGSAGSFAGGVVGGAVGAAIGFVMGAGAASVPAALIFGKAGAAIGVLFGGKAGAVSGLRYGLETIRKEDMAALRNHYTPRVTEFLEDNQRRLRNDLDDIVTDLEGVIRNGLNGQLQREKSSCEAAIQRMQEARKLSIEAANRRAAELKPSLEKLDHFGDQIRELARAITTPEARAALPSLGPATAAAVEPSGPGTGPDPDADYGDWANG